MLKVKPKRGRDFGHGKIYVGESLGKCQKKLEEESEVS